MIELRMPDLGQTVAEMKVVVWHKKVGDQVKMGDVLLEVETDKATTEVESYADGVLEEIFYEEGSEILAGDMFARLREK